MKYIKIGFHLIKSTMPGLRVLLILLLFSYIPHAQAQRDLIKFENYSKDDGLLHSQILSICQDRRGLIWIGSYGGLNRFDGTNFVSYNTENSDLPRDVIFSILEPKREDENILWLGTHRGLIKFNKETNSIEYFEKINTRIFSIAEGEDGILWLATLDQGLWKFNPESKEYTSTIFSIKHQNSPSAFSINCFLYEQTGVMWLGTDKGGLFKYDCRNDSFVEIPGDSENGDLVRPLNISCLHKHGSELLIGTIGGGLYVYDKAKETLLNITSSLSGNKEIHNSITSIAEDNSGSIWLSTFGGGLYRIEGFNNIKAEGGNYEIRNFRQGDEGADNVCSNLLNLIYKDYTGNFWIGSEGGGISKIDFFKHRISHFVVEEPGGKRVRDNNISAIFEDVNGNIWCGVRNCGLYIYNMERDEYRHILLSPESISDRQNFVHDIYGDKYNRIWVSTDKGLFLFREGYHAEKILNLDVPVANSVIRNAYITMCLDQNDGLWFCNGVNGLFRINKEEIDRADPEDAVYSDYTEILFDSVNMSSYRVWGITQATDGSMWFASSAGLHRYNVEKDNFENFFTTAINSVFEPESGSGDYFWLGTFGGGIFLFNKTDLSTVNFNKSIGLSHNNVSGIIEDRQGNIWLSTAKGISSIYTKGLYLSEGQYIDDESVMSRIRNYGKTDGLQAHEFNLNAAVRLGNGNLVFGGPNGFNLFDPLTIEDNKYVCSSLITDFKIFNRSVLNDSVLCPGSIEYLKEIELNYKQNYFTIDFTAICFTSPEEVKYQFMLEGFDKEWIDVDAAHSSATYTKIKPDDYIFKVKASNSDGLANDEFSALKISIDPPFWEALHVRIIALIFILLLVISIIHNQKRLISRQKARELQSQKEKYEKEMLQSELDNKNRELAQTTMFIVKKNEKLIQVRNMMNELKENILVENKPRFMEIFNSINNDVKNQDKWESFELNFNLIHNNFIARLIERYPTLSHNDVKICAYIRMNMSSKEIANLLNITPKSLETNRVRIRKRMELDSSVYLSNYIMRF